MPITAFNSFTDGLDANRRSREHFITNTNLEDDRLWVPYAEGVWFQQLPTIAHRDREALAPWRSSYPRAKLKRQT